MFVLLALAFAMATWMTVAGAASSNALAVALYYGADAPLDELKAFDIAVVDSGHGYRPDAYRQPGSELYAYVAVGEAHPSRPYYKDIAERARLAHNKDWGSLIIDLSDPGWPEFVAKKIVGPLWAAGYRGFFLDTLDSYRLAPKFDEAAQQRGLISVIETLHHHYPGIRLIANRGFDVVPRVRDKLQMVAAESLFRGWDAGGKRYREVSASDREWLLTQLRRVRDESGLPVLVIDYVPPEARALARETATRIRSLGFVPWVADAALDMLGVGQREVMPRKVLVIHDGSSAPALNYTEAHRYGDMPLNHLGYVAEHRDLTEPLPSFPLIGRYAGVVVWLGASAPRPAAFAQWLERTMQQGLPIAFVGEFGLPQDTATLRRLGLRSVELPGPGPLVIARQQDMFGFEAPVRPDARALQSIALAGNGDALLELADTSGRRYVAAAIMPWGGFVLDPYVIRELTGTEQSRWLVDPFAFLQRALRLPAMPVPDTTTENGRRLLIAHIDGDGFPSRAELPGTPLAGRVLLDDVLKRYPIPHAVSIIEGEIAAHGLHPQHAAEMEGLARAMFALPHVEIATHTFSHPFRWDNTVRHGRFKDAGETYHLPLPGYKLDLRREIAGSSDYIRNTLAPRGKAVKLLLWTGDTAPNAEALRLSVAAGLLNMNGGDTQITRSNPSLTAVGPLGLSKGGVFQVYAPIANENVYTNLWQGPYYGYQRVIETFELTERPRRLKPIGIYFHSYSASKRAALEALHKVYRWALAQPVHPVFPTDFIAKVLDFNSAVIAREGDEWLYRGRGALRTLRLSVSGGIPDLASAHGLIGFAQSGNERYLHLAGATARFRSRAASIDRNFNEPYLASANARVDAWHNDGQGLRMTLSGHVPLEFTVHLPRPCRPLHNGRPLTPVSTSAQFASFRLSDVAATLQISCA